MLIPVLAVFMPIVAGMGGNAGDADADRGRARHRPWRADVEQLTQGAAERGGRRPRQRHRARRRWRPLVVWLMRGNPVLGHGARRRR